MRLKIMMTCFFGILLLFTIVPAASLAIVPQQINYQGYLADSGGNPVSDGNYTMSFDIFDVSTGGVPLWSESQTVTVKDGVYTVILGQPGNPINPDIFDGDRYLGVTVGTDGEMTPRQKLTATAFAMKAAKADSVSDGAVTSVMLANGAVDADKVADNAITSAKIADSTITAADINGGPGSGLDADKLDGHDTAYFATATTVIALQAQVADLQNQVNTLVTLLANVTRKGNDITFSGVNVHIVNGTEATETTNGFGNLIVGYNSTSAGPLDGMRNGSHNIIIGDGHEYSKHSELETTSIVAKPDALNIVSASTINLAAGLDFNLNVANNANFKVGSNATLLAGTDVSLNAAKNLNLTMNDLNLNAKRDGNILVGRDLALSVQGNTNLQIYDLYLGARNLQFDVNKFSILADSQIALRSGGDIIFKGTRIYEN